MFDTKKQLSPQLNQPSNHKTNQTDDAYLNENKNFPFKKINEADGKENESSPHIQGNLAHDEIKIDKKLAGYKAPAEDIFADNQEDKILPEKIDIKDLSEKNKSLPLKSTPQVPSMQKFGQSKLNSKALKTTIGINNALPSMSEEVKPIKSKKRLKAIIIIVLAVFALGIISSFVYRYYFSLSFDAHIQKNNSAAEQNLQNLLNKLNNKSTILKNKTKAKKNQKAINSKLNSSDAGSLSDKKNNSVRSDSLLDSDNDGLTNEEELKLGTNPAKFDTDNDGLSDFEEVEIYNSDPTNPDTDKDGYKDGFEVSKGFDPLEGGGAKLSK